LNLPSILPPARIGFVGLGQMGLPMSRRLAKAGYRVVAHDLNHAAIERACEGTGAEPSGSLAAMGRRCEAVITMLPDGGAVAMVALGPGGTEDCLASGMAPGGVLIDMSSSSPVTTCELGARLAERGIALIDAPVSGGVRRALDGSLAIMAGGEPANVERCRPVLEAMGKQIFLTGALASGHAMKAINNYVSAAGLIAATEGVLMAQRFGLDAGRVVDILNASSGMNNSTLNKFHQFILNRAFNSGFSLDLMVKDLKIALEVARETGSPELFAAECLRAWTEAQAALGPGADHTAVVRYWERLAGSELGTAHKAP